MTAHMFLTYLARIRYFEISMIGILTKLLVLQIDMNFYPDDRLSLSFG